MQLYIIPQEFSICKVADFSMVDVNAQWVFTAHTDQEKSLVCPTTMVPHDTLSRDDGWRAFRIEGVLDFGLIGILSQISTVLAEGGVGIFALSTFNTDYILTKASQFPRAIELLKGAHHSFVGSRI